MTMLACVSTSLVPASSPWLLLAARNRFNARDAPASSKVCRDMMKTGTGTAFVAGTHAKAGRALISRSHAVRMILEPAVRALEDFLDFCEVRLPPQA